MYTQFLTPTGTVRFWYLGQAYGGFAEKYAPGVGARNFDRLRRRRGVGGGTTIIPSSGYEIVPEPQLAEQPAAALITTRVGYGLLLRPADCIPLVVYSLGQRLLLALIHAGRRELEADSIARTIITITRELGIPPQELGAYLGPGIKGRSYRLPCQIAGELHHPTWAACINGAGGGDIYVDTFAFARAELERLGVPRRAVTVSTIDTATNPQYYSHYAATRFGAEQGRNGCLVYLAAKAGSLAGTRERSYQV